MNIQWQTMILSDGDLCNFTFDKNIASFAAGISYFDLTFPLLRQNSFNLKEMGVTLVATQTGNQVIQVKATFDMSDGSGNTFDPSLSKVYVTVVARLGNDSTGLFLVDTPDVSNSQGQTLAPNGTPVFNAAFMNSFKGSYASANNIMDIDGGVSVSYITGNGLTVKGNFGLDNGNGATSNSQMVEAGVIAPLIAGTGIDFQLVPFDDPSGGASKTVTFNKEVTNAIAIINGFQFKFKNAAGITGIYGGLVISDPATPNGPPIPRISINPDNKKQVTLSYAGTMFDYASNTQCITNHVDLLVIVTTAAS